MTLTESSGGLLPILNDAMPHRLVAVLRDFLVKNGGAVDAGLLLADYELSELRRLSARPGDDLVRPVDGTPTGQCFAGQVVVSEVLDGGTRLLVPLSLRAERLGVLEVLFAEQPIDTELLDGLQEVALAVAYVLVACGSCSDVVEVARRAVPLSVAAEMQWNLQPLRAFEDGSFSIAGQLIPAYDVGGDCFDYNVDSRHLDLSSLDAMGHGVHASVLAGLATAVMRNARRAGCGPAEQVAAADRQLIEHFGGAQFVTALAMRLDVSTGRLDVVNAGHPSPWLVRDGRASAFELNPQLPAGMFETTDYLTQQVHLEAGDRLVLVTDGLLEAGAPGPEFGEQQLAGLLLATAHLSPHQCVAEVLRTVRTFAPTMHDDATVVCLDWRGPVPV